MLELVVVLKETNVSGQRNEFLLFFDWLTAKINHLISVCLISLISSVVRELNLQILEELLIGRDLSQHHLIQLSGQPLVLPTRATGRLLRLLLPVAVGSLPRP